MKIEQLNIKAFRGIQDAFLHFEGASTVIFGNNGAGKTSVLAAINLLYSNIINSIVKNRFKQGIRIEGNDVKFKNTECSLTVDFSFKGNMHTYSRFYNKKTNKRTHSIGDIKGFLNYFETLYDDSECFKYDVPVFANYGVHRLVLNIPLRIRQHHDFDVLSTYEKAIESKLDFRTFFEWFRNREDFENEIIAHENNSYEDRQLKAVKNAVLAFFDDYSDLRVRRNPLVMEITKGQTRLNISQLSDGEKCTLALIGDLARRVAIANPTLDNPLTGSGIALIDEIELHLHPLWQRKIIPTLRKTFPNIQFIFTTHSPQVLSEIDEAMKVFVANNNQENNNIEFTELRPLNGWDVNDILGNFMNTPEINADTQKLIDEIYDNIDFNNFDIAEKLIAELRKKTNSNNKTVIELQFILNKRKGIL